MRQKGNATVCRVGVRACIGDESLEQTPPARRRKYAASAIMMCFLMISLQSARSGEKDPHEMTALGVISENVREIYAREVEACYNEAMADLEARRSSHPPRGLRRQQRLRLLFFSQLSIL